MIDLTLNVWQSYFPDTFNGNCLCCGKSIRYPDFHKGHIIADSKNGEYNISNLLPLCMSCNLKMNNIDFFSFKSKYFPDVKIKIPIEKENDLLKLENSILRKQLNVTKDIIDDKEKIEQTDIVSSTYSSEYSYYTSLKDYFDKINYKPNGRLKLINDRWAEIEKTKDHIKFYLVIYKSNKLSCAVSIPKTMQENLSKKLIEERENIKRDFNIDFIPRTENGNYFATFLEKIDIKNLLNYEKYNIWYMKNLNILRSVIEKYHRTQPT